MIPMVLVTGFLGSGKTTFLNRLVQQYRDRKLVYLINEFSPVDIDGQLLDCPAGDMVSVAGGSIFCKCLVTQFIYYLDRISRQEAGDSRPIEAVVVEASGVADPRVVHKMLAETELDRRYRLSQVVTIIDPKSFLPLLHTLPNIRAQVEASTVCLINKIDLCPAEELDKTDAELRRINPSAAIVRTQYCRADIDWLRPAGAAELDGDYTQCADPHYFTLHVSLEEEIDFGRLSVEIENLFDDIYRIKGFVPVVGDRLYLDVSPAGMSVSQAAVPQGLNELVFIVRGDAWERTQDLVFRIERGQFNVSARFA